MSELSFLVHLPIRHASDAFGVWFYNTDVDLTIACSVLYPDDRPETVDKTFAAVRTTCASCVKDFDKTR